MIVWIGGTNFLALHSPQSFSEPFCLHLLKPFCVASLYFSTADELSAAQLYPGLSGPTHALPSPDAPSGSRDCGYSCSCCLHPPHLATGGACGLVNSLDPYSNCLQEGRIPCLVRG